MKLVYYALALKRTRDDNAVHNLLSALPIEAKIEIDKVLQADWLQLLASPQELMCRCRDLLAKMTMKYPILIQHHSSIKDLDLHTLIPMKEPYTKNSMMWTLSKFRECDFLFFDPDTSIFTGFYPKNENAAKALHKYYEVLKPCCFTVDALRILDEEDWYDLIQRNYSYYAEKFFYFESIANDEKYLKSLIKQRLGCYLIQKNRPLADNIKTIEGFLEQSRCPILRADDLPNSSRKQHN